MKRASEIGFGIEIECLVPVEYRDVVRPGSYHHGNGLGDLAPSAGWNVQSDSSVHPDRPGYFPVEIVSPKLSGESGLIEVVQMCDRLTEMGVICNPSCGLHVHVSSDHLDPAHVDRLVKLFKIFEPAFFDMNGTAADNRYTNFYCKNSARWDGSRYQSLNLTNHERGHIEIRVWAGSIKPEFVVAAIYMAVSLASRASDDKPVKTSHLTSNKRQLMAEYIRQFVIGDYMIIPDMDPADLFVEMMQDANRSNR